MSRLGVLEERRHQEIADAGRGRPVELARPLARLREQLRERSDLHGGRRHDGHHGVRDPGDRHEIGDVVGQLVVQKGMRGEGGGRREQQRVIVMGADEGADRRRCRRRRAGSRPPPACPSAPTAGRPTAAPRYRRRCRGPSGTMKRTLRCGQVSRRRRRCRARNASPAQIAEITRRMRIINLPGRSWRGARHHGKLPQERIGHMGPRVTTGDA